MSHPGFICIYPFVSLNRDYVEKHSVQNCKPLCLSFVSSYLVWQSTSYIMKLLSLKAMESSELSERYALQVQVQVFLFNLGSH